MSLAPDPLRPPVLPAPAAPMLGNLMAMASMVTWAAGFPLAEVLMERWGVLALVTARFALAVAMLIPLWMLIDGPRAVAAARWGRGAVIGGIGFGLGAWLLLIAQRLTDPVTVAIIASATPIAATVIEILFDGRRLTGAFVLGLAASVAGGAVAVQGPAAGGDLVLGAGLAVVACFLFVWASRATVKSLPGMSDLGRTTITLAGGSIMTGAIFLAAYGGGWASLPEDGWQQRDIGLLALYALASLALSQVLWIASVGRLGVALASFHINISPFYVMVILLALGGGWNWQQALGAGIVGAGVVLAQWRRRPRVAH